MANEQPSPVLRYLRGVVGAGEDDTRSDQELIFRFVRARDEAAFAALVRRHGPMVWGVCRRVLRHHHDAEDAFQATFIILARKAATLRDPSRLGCWLYGVACRGAAKARALTARRPNCDLLSQEVPARAEGDDVSDRELASVLDEEIARLPEKFRLPVIQCYLIGLTNEEAARRLGCPKGTILSRLATARERLRLRLIRRGLALSGAALTAVLADRSLSAPPPLSLTVSSIKAAAESHSPAAIALAKGVLLTMTMKKVLIAGLVVFAAVMLTLGLGAMGPGPGAGVFVVAGDSPRDDQGGAPATPLSPEQLEREKNEIRNHLQDRREKLETLEEKMAAEVTDLRLTLVDVEESLKALEREHGLKLEKRRVELQRFEPAQRRIDDQLAALKDEMKKVYRTVADPKEQERLAGPIQSQIKEKEFERRDLDKAIEQLGLLAVEREYKAALLELRAKQIRAEATLHNLERKNALSRASLEADIEALEARRRQVEGINVATSEGDLNRKLDRLLKEVTELRQELKRGQPLK